MTKTRLVYSCGIRDLNVLLIRDVFDFVLFFFLTFVFLVISSHVLVTKLNMSRKDVAYISLQNRKYKMSLFKFVIGPIAFILVNLPIFVVTFVSDYHLIKANSAPHHTSIIKPNNYVVWLILYVVSFFLNQLNYVILFVTNMIFNKNFFRAFLDIIFINKSLINNIPVVEQ